MQCGSNLSAIFLAFDGGGGLVCVPRSGAGASGGVGAASGWARDELSFGGAVGLDCASRKCPGTKHKRQIAKTRAMVSTSPSLTPGALLRFAVPAVESAP